MTESQVAAVRREETRGKYAAMASKYDRMEGLPEILGLRLLRRDLFSTATGEVLEVAAGTGKNLRFFPEACRVTAVELSPEMLDIARGRAQKLGREVEFGLMPAEQLAFPDHRFDTVASSLSLCTFAEPLVALTEMGRVCRPGGRILLLEHGRSSVGWLGSFQDRKAESHARPLGCHWNLEPRELAETAGLRAISARRVFLGIFHLLVLGTAE